MLNDSTQRNPDFIQGNGSCHLVSGHFDCEKRVEVWKHSIKHKYDLVCEHLKQVRPFKLTQGSVYSPQKAKLFPCTFVKN